MMRLAAFDIDDTTITLDYSGVDEKILMTAMGPSGRGKQVRIDVGFLVDFPRKVIEIADLAAPDGPES